MRRDIGTGDPRVRVRPDKGSRPHAKTRPGYSSVRTAEVMGVDRGRYRPVLADGLAVAAVKARELGCGSVVVGDRVRVTGDVSGKKDTLARVVSVEAHASRLLHSTEEGNGRERCIVANAQQLAIATALADPSLKTGMIDRCLITARDAGMESLFVLTKADLASPDRLLDSYEVLGLHVVVIDLKPHRNSEVRRLEEGDAETSGLEALRKALASVEMVLVGHSGVGKSTLISALVPNADRATGEVNTVTGKGRHTSTPAVSLTPPGDGRIIGTPRVRSFGLAHVSPQNVLRGFTDLAAITGSYSRNYEHGWNSPGCMLSRQTDLRLIARTASFRQLLAACTEDWS